VEIVVLTFRFDYIQRDSQLIGEPIRIDSNRYFLSFCEFLFVHTQARSIVNSARIIQEQICYDIKDANQLYEICATRFKLHKMIYNHKAGEVVCHSLLRHI